MPDLTDTLTEIITAMREAGDDSRAIAQAVLYAVESARLGEQRKKFAQDWDQFRRNYRDD